MEKTTYYQLNKPEVTDPLRVADFNENSDIIDGALAACGNCKIETGSYVGDGRYGSSDTSLYTRLAFETTPKLIVIIGSAASHTLLLIPPMSTAPVLCAQYTAIGGVNVFWEEGEVAWWGNSAGAQMNIDDVPYYYIMFF